MKKNILTLILLLNFVQIYANYLVEVKSFGNYSMDNKSFFIESIDKYKVGDIEFELYANKLAQYLIIQGGNITKDKINADVCIFLDYGIGESAPLVHSHPIFGNTGISSIRTTTDYWGNTTSYVNHSVGIVGYSTSETEQYRRYIDIYAYDNQSFSDDNPKMIWKTNIESTGWKNDLQTIYPYMLYAARSYLGSQTTEKKSISLSDNLIDYNALMHYIDKDFFIEGSIIIYPPTEIVSDKVQDVGLKIQSIKITDKTTTIIFEYPTSNSVKISSDIYMEIDGEIYYAISSYGFTLNNYIPRNSTRFVSIDFDPIPTNSKRIDYIQDGQKKKLLLWGNITLK